MFTLEALPIPLTRSLAKDSQRRGGPLTRGETVSTDLPPEDCLPNKHGGAGTPEKDGKPREGKPKKCESLFIKGAVSAQVTGGTSPSEAPLSSWLDQSPSVHNPYWQKRSVY